MRPPSEDHHVVVDPVDGHRWEVDLGFLASSWRCRWGDGCLGILADPAPELEQGCCSVGAAFVDEAEARRIGALGLALDPDRFQYADDALTGGIYADEGRAATRVVDGACIFFNRPGFAGGVGCALHLGALDEGDDPIDHKPAVCWQLPLRIDRLGDGRSRLRRWRRSDWFDGGSTVDGDGMAWCCTEDRAPVDAYDGTEPVIDTLATELGAVLGDEVVVELRRRLGRAQTEAPTDPVD